MGALYLILVVAVLCGPFRMGSDSRLHLTCDWRACHPIVFPLRTRQSSSAAPDGSLSHLSRNHGAPLSATPPFSRRQGTKYNDQISDLVVHLRCFHHPDASR
eukprot:5431288-Amphidinium_carterae.1